MRVLALLSLLLCLLAPAAIAVQPDEVLADPALESRARAISQLLRCPVCQSENIDESNATVARDLRLLVRERLLAGDSDAEVVDYVTDRYGEYVLFRPPARGSNLILWLTGPAMLLVGLGVGWIFLRGRRGAEPPLAALDADEERRIAELLKE
ncbi:cytochrome c-type biogenesis protein [Frigidibacter oleivorans]|uniref:cytochrome c-type biogenesis protein n=1 Tax=Frigidibacter oleivorans TaxID=2487129 RepID=UPI000F8EDD04|nr:cytochrome c-type biogenesis protein [Frigidibacter oleivorans]